MRIFSGVSRALDVLGSTLGRMFSTTESAVQSAELTVREHVPGTKLGKLHDVMMLGRRTGVMHVCLRCGRVAFTLEDARVLAHQVCDRA